MSRSPNITKTEVTLNKNKTNIIIIMLNVKIN